MNGHDPRFFELHALLQKRVCAFGVGNRARGDDGAGSILAERLSDTPGVCAIDAGTIPENYLEPAVRSRSDVIVIIDAADFGGEPGDWHLLDPLRVNATGLSTHVLSLSVIAEYFALRSPAQVILLGIQPAVVAPMTKLSEPVSRTVRTLSHTIRGIAVARRR